jgi:hypothetical protein
VNGNRIVVTKAYPADELEINEIKFSDDTAFIPTQLLMEKRS